MNETGMYIGILRDSLKRKKNYLEEIAELTSGQSELAGSDSFDEEAFGRIVDRKEILINNINEIDKGFTSVYDRVRGNLLEEKDLYKAELNEIQELINVCMEKGAEIEVLEERNRQKLEMVFASERKNLRQVKNSRTVANRYYKTMSNSVVNDAMLYDRKK
ncbi:MAG: hypothetical protein IJ054_03555 [Lachnospiraceae bacterium]|nr:hypothetical protein [Lachnospiraceae bacterium]MBQ9234169.1 hypothetical protein [Lachnospiraceae bacterium]